MLKFHVCGVQFCSSLVYLPRADKHPFPGSSFSITLPIASKEKKFNQSHCTTLYLHTQILRSKSIKVGLRPEFNFGTLSWFNWNPVLCVNVEIANKARLKEYQQTAISINFIEATPRSTVTEFDCNVSPGGTSSKPATFSRRINQRKSLFVEC